MTRPDPRIVAGKAVRGMVVQRLARGYPPLFALVVIGGIGLFTETLTVTLALGVITGALVVAGALLLMGQVAARRAFGLPSTGAWRLARGVWLVAWAWGLWAVAVPGFLVARAALSKGEWIGLALAALTAILAIRVVVDTLRLSELGRLGDTMAMPAPEERAEE